ncbi:MAG: hypothetical protein ACOCVF_02965 [bacterium]
MGNMSYCRFENTSRDLADCAENLEDELSSEFEIRAREDLIKICADILERLNIDVNNDDVEEAIKNLPKVKKC